MSKILDCRYTGGDRAVIRLTADLDAGWQDLADEWGFDGSGSLNYEIESKFQCRLRFVAKAPEWWETRTRFPASEYLTRLSFGWNVVMVYGSRLIVDLPLEQPWRPDENETDCPSIYGFEPSLYSEETTDGKIEYQVQVWVTLHGSTKKFVRHEYDWGEGFAWMGSQSA
jgi:hypothetical protein